MLMSVGKAVGRTQVVGPGECLDSTKLNGVVLVERLTLGVVGVSEWLHKNIPVALVISYLMVQSRDSGPIVLLYLLIRLSVVFISCEMLQPKEVAYRFENLQIVCNCPAKSRLVSRKVQTSCRKTCSQYASRSFSGLALLVQD